MSIEISALDLHYLVEEMLPLREARIDKIAQPTKDTVVFQFYVKGKEKQMLKIALPNLFYLTTKKPETAEKLLGFCAALRKYLSNAMLLEIKQLGSERIASLLFKAKGEEYLLFIELFAKGNIILCRKDLTIIVPVVAYKTKEREIKAGARYSCPKKEINFFKLSFADLKNSLKKQKQAISRMLAVDFGFGGQYARELCLLSCIGQQEKDIDDKQIKALFNSIRLLINKKISPLVAYSDSEIKAVLPFELEIYKDLRKERQKTFNSAVNFVVQAETKKPMTKTQKELEKLQKIITMQQNKIRELQKAAEENQRKGELVYEKYQLLSQIIEEIRKARKKYSWKEIKDKLKGHKLIKEVNEKTGEIVVDI